MSAPLPPFQSFLDSERELVLRFLLRAVGPGEAEDCFQETFMAALRAYPRLHRGSNLRAWILTIAHRKALDAHRARARRPQPMADPAAVGDRALATRAPGSHPSGSPAAGDSELWQAVERLPARQRSAVVLRYMADLPHRDIAAAIGCSEAAARRSLHEGLSKLRMAELR